MELRRPGLPQFLNALIAHEATHELYLCVDMGGLKRDEDQSGFGKIFVFIIINEAKKNIYYLKIATPFFY